MEEAERDKRMLSVINWLSPADVDHDQEALVAVRQEHPGSGLWLFANDQVKTWIDPDSSLVPCLWLNGIPGAGSDHQFHEGGDSADFARENSSGIRRH